MIIPITSIVVFSFFGHTSMRVVPLLLVALCPWLPSLWFHTRCRPVNISKGLCGLRLVHKGRFQHPGRRRLCENRGLSVRPGMQTIFNTAKIKLREKGAMPGSSSVIIFHIVGPLSPLIMHSMARRKKKRRGEGEKYAEQ